MIAKMKRLESLDQEEIYEIFCYVKGLRKKKLSYREITKKVEKVFNIKISESTLKRWCNNWSNPFNRVKKS